MNLEQALVIAPFIKDFYDEDVSLIEYIKQLAFVSENQATDIVNLTKTLSEISKMAEELVSHGDILMN